VQGGYERVGGSALMTGDGPHLFSPNAALAEGADRPYMRDLLPYMDALTLDSTPSRYKVRTALICGTAR